MIHSSPETCSERFLTQNIHAASLSVFPESDWFVLQLHFQIWTGRASLDLLKFSFFLGGLRFVSVVFFSKRFGLCFWCWHQFFSFLPVLFSFSALLEISFKRRVGLSSSPSGLMACWSEVASEWRERKRLPRAVMVNLIPNSRFVSSRLKIISSV